MLIERKMLKSQKAFQTHNTVDGLAILNSIFNLAQIYYYGITEWGQISQEYYNKAFHDIKE